MRMCGGGGGGRVEKEIQDGVAISKMERVVGCGSTTNRGRRVVTKESLKLMLVNTPKQQRQNKDPTKNAKKPSQRSHRPSEKDRGGRGLRQTKKGREASNRKKGDVKKSPQKTPERSELPKPECQTAYGKRTGQAFISITQRRNQKERDRRLVE